MSTDSMQTALMWVQILSALTSAAAVVAAVWVGTLPYRPKMRLTALPLRFHREHGLPRMHLQLQFALVRLAPVYLQRVELRYAQVPKYSVELTLLDGPKLSAIYDRAEPTLVQHGTLVTRWVDIGDLHRRIAIAGGWATLAGVLLYRERLRALELVAVASTGAEFTCRVPDDLQNVIWHALAARRRFHLLGDVNIGAPWEHVAPTP